MKDLIIDYEETKAAIEECMEDYVCPIFIVGEMEPIEGMDEITTISATIPKEELIIKNNQYPKWLDKVMNNSFKNENILYIKDFQELSQDEQELFVEIICKNRVSSEELPDNLKIVINSKYECPIIQEISEVIQYFKF